MRISFEHCPVAVTGHQRYLFDAIASLKQSAYGFVPQVVQVEVFQPERSNCPRESGS